MEKLKERLVKRFVDSSEMIAWLTNSKNVEDLKRKYPPEDYSAKVDMANLSVTVKKK